MISLVQQKRPFRLGLTPMIDVVFLLLVFFMLAARFGANDAINLSAVTSGGSYEGPPRLVTIAPDGVRLNGALVAQEWLPDALGPLMTVAGDPVVLRPVDGAGLQGLVDVMTVLTTAGLTNLIVVE